MLHARGGSRLSASSPTAPVSGEESKRHRRLGGGSPSRVALAVLTVGLVALFKLRHGSKRDDAPCTGACAARLLARTRAALLARPGMDAATSVHSMTVPATRPYTLATCTQCNCDVCEFVEQYNVFAPVESLIFEHILNSDACDGTKAVVDVGANLGTFMLLAAQYECAPVVAFEPNAAPRALAAASLSLNGARERVTLLPYAIGASHGTAVVDQSADVRWGLAAMQEAPPDEVARLRSRGVGDAHTLGDGIRTAQPGPSGLHIAARPSSAAGDDGAVPIVPLSDVPQLTRNLLLLKIDTEGYESSVLPGCWAIFDAGRTVDNVLVEIKSWNSRAKRDLMRHLARTANLNYIYTYQEQYSMRVESLAALSLNGRLLDVSSIILEAQYDAMLPHEDFWFRREPVLSQFLE